MGFVRDEYDEQNVWKSDYTALTKSTDKQITQLKADLAKYGGHTAECDTHNPCLDVGAGSAQVPPLRKCGCGFDKAKERWV